MSVQSETLIPAIKEILVNDLNLNVSFDQIADDEQLVDGGLNLDSIVIVELIGVLETKFNFQFQDADLRTATFANLASLAEVIAKRAGN